MRDPVSDYSALAVAVFTCGLFVVAFLQWRTYQRQAHLMQQGLEETQRAVQVAERNAAAATASADAAANTVAAFAKVERAYVTMSVRHPGVRFPRLPTEEILYAAPESKRPVKVTIEIRNHGNTPARITSTLVGHYQSVMDPLEPDLVPIDQTRRFGPVFLTRNDSIAVEHEFCLTRQHAEGVHNGTLRLWIVGTIDYIDHFGTRHRYGYARVYDPKVDQGQEGENLSQDNLSFWPDARLNYDRERVRGEGEDWI